MEHQACLEFSHLFWKDLIHLREKSREFTSGGTIDCEYLKEAGSFFNQFSIRQDQAIAFWTSEQQVNPDRFLIQSFSSQSGKLTDDTLQEKWWKRSYEILPQGADVCFGVKKGIIAF
ncbi:MAG: hypothetical protein IT584_01495 [Chlamydiae bacterium]|nr:hypothetical protein [Chlamydiota bacterium]